MEVCFYILYIQKDDKASVTNYRPINKLCIISKLFEKLIYNQLSSLLRNCFNEFQHGFLQGRSTSTNEYITEHEQGKTSGASVLIGLTIKD